MVFCYWYYMDTTSIAILDMKIKLAKSISFLHYPILFIVVMSLFSCASTTNQIWKSLEGKVLNATDGKPIDNALVFAIWKGQMLDKGETLRVCYHVESAISDNKRLFSLQSWQEQNNYTHITEKSTAMIVYKPGYWREVVSTAIPTKNPIKLYVEINSNRNQQIIPEYRLKYLQKIVGSTACHLDDSDRKKLSVLYGSVLKEAKTVAETEDDEIIVQSIKSWTRFASK